MTITQLRMFQTKDLPLFSSTAPRRSTDHLEASPGPQQLPTVCEF